MSDNWIILIPENPRCVPTLEKQERAIQKLRELTPKSEEVKVEISDEIRFVDCGGNFERVLCSQCGKELDTEWWQSRMGEDYGAGFQLNAYLMPCCGAKKNLHELRYEWPQGFAKFSLESMNPNVGELTKEDVKALETTLDCPLRVIYSHI